VSIQPSDLQPDHSIQLFEDGDEVTNQVTLDLCGATFPSEALRRARYQVGVADGRGKLTGVSTEAVLYNNAAAAAQALNEVSAAEANCPPGFVNGDVEGEPPLRYSFGADPDANWPSTGGVRRLTLAPTVTDKQGNSFSSVEVFQVRGPLLVGFYLDDDAIASTVASSATPIQTVAVAIAKRMAALPG
jgi:hypothetical protein